MRRRVERSLRKHTAKLTRVAAVDKARVLACLEKGSCAKDHRAKVLGSDYLNTEGYLYWQLHRKGIFTPGELGCTFSHLKAIQQASDYPNPNPITLTPRYTGAYHIREPRRLAGVAAYKRFAEGGTARQDNAQEGDAVTGAFTFELTAVGNDAFAALRAESSPSFG